LETLLPWVDWSKAEFATFTVQRAEAHQQQGVRPADPGVFRDGRVIAAWPTKLALAPLLAERVEALLRTLAVKPQPLDLRVLADWPRPEVAAPPWDWRRRRGIGRSWNGVEAAGRDRVTGESAGIGHGKVWP